MMNLRFSRQSFLSDTAILFYLAGAKVLIHLFTNQNYGFHRDELYYLLDGERLAWGYVDHPPVTPLLAKIAASIFGYEVGGLRLFSALAGGVVVFLAGKMAKELGGGRKAQILAAGSVIAMPLFLATNTLFQTVSFDQVCWVFGLYLLIRLLKTGDLRYWLLIGLVAGIGLQTKYTIVFFGAGMVIGMLLTHHRKQFQTIYPYLGGLIALLIFMPNIIWQIQNDFPSLEFTRNSNANYRAEEPFMDFFILQLLLVGPFLLPLVLAGLYWLWRSKEYRPLAWIYIFSIIVMALQGAKPYYIGPTYPVLAAAGAVYLEQLIAQKQWNPRRTWQIASALIILNGLIPLPIVLPVLPEKAMAENNLWEMNEDFGEMVGWHEFVGQVTDIYNGLPAEDREKATIMTASYGEASAINILGKNLPEAISGHNSYYFWGPGKATGDVVIAVRMDENLLKQHFEDVQQVWIINTPYDIENEIYGQPIFVCRQPKKPLKAMWDDFKHYN